MFEQRPHVFSLLRILCCGWLLVCVALGQRIQPGNDKPPTTGGVRGRVVYGDTGHPVRLAPVRLLSLEKPDEPEGIRVHMPPPGYEGGEASIAGTDLSGAFSFEAVEPGRYAAVVLDDNLIDFGSRFKEGANPLLEGKRSAEMFDGWFPVFTVTAGATAEIEITARRGGVIAGYVRYHDGAPVAEAPLSLFRRTHEGPLERVKFTYQNVKADPRGYYRITGLLAGEYVVRAADRDVEVSPGHDETVVRSAGRLFYAYHPAERGASKARLVTVQEGVETPDTDITIPEVPVRLVSGTVTAKGKPLVGASLSASYRDPDTGEELEPLQAVTGADGAFRLSGLPDGAYKLTVDAENARLVGAENKPANALDAEQELKIAGADQNDKVIELQTGGVVSGAVVAAPGAKVDFTFVLFLVEEKAQAEADDYWDNPNRAYLEKPGPFAFERLSTGVYRFNWDTTGDSDSRFYLQKVLYQERDISNEPLKLTQGETFTDLRFVVATDFAQLSGRAYSDAAYKQPLAEGVVYFVPVQPKQIVYQDWHGAETDEKGAFELDLPPGEYYAVAAKELAEDKLEAFVKQHAARLPRVTLKPNAKVEKWRVAESRQQ